FGPIVFLHFFLLAGILLLLRFDRTLRATDLGLGFFLFGVALWHKALFIWMLNGLVIATLLVFPKRVRTLISPRRAAVAAISFGVGALPLIYYNAVTAGATLHIGSVMSGKAPFSAKLLILKRTVDGSVLFGWMTEEGPAGTALPPLKLDARISVKIARTAGGTRRNGML